jgi:3-hydroxyisobutyrate dehydrogenase
MKIGFIGLGNLGKAMAQRLISEGLDLVVWNRTIDKAKGLQAEIAKNPAEVMTKSEVIFLNVFDSGAVSAVLSGDNGLLRGKCEGRLVIDTTTNHFEAVPLFYELVEKSGASYIESPIFGSVLPASKGALTIVVSGDKKSYEKARPYLDKLGSNIFYLPTPTHATRMKLINNMVLGSFMTTIAEAAAYGEAAGIGRAKALEILGAGAGNSGVLHGKKQSLIDDNYAAQFTVDAIYKDLHYAQDLAEELKRPLFMAGLARELFGMARARGRGGDDFSAVFDMMNKLK